ncbi:MAG TPA: sigma-70 family RNA polymerase sigma factor [Longimicrobiaceae bacterium]|nr:sigma-70 family RNA polymerase sigma factor [Longimicrobiaceae bacterium]
MDPTAQFPAYTSTGSPTADRSGRLPPGPADDRALVRGMAAGDEAALAALYDRWSTLVHSVAAQAVADPDDAAEVVGEVFWQAWRQAGRYQEGRGAVSTWLAMIARSRALDRVRARRRVRETESPAAPGALLAVAAEGDPLQGAESAERRDLLAQALGALPSDQRESMELAYFRGMSQSEIAAHTGQPLGTIKTRVRLAARKLRDRLAVLREAAH